jgi:hypothetical protein
VSRGVAVSRGCYPAERQRPDVGARVSESSGKENGTRRIAFLGESFRGSGGGSGTFELKGGLVDNGA